MEVISSTEVLLFHWHNHWQRGCSYPVLAEVLNISSP